MSKKILIVGGVAGGATAAARLRRLDENAEIILFERGEYVSFANCGLPYYIGKTIEPREALFVSTPEAIHGKYCVDVRVSNEVIAIDRDKKEVKVKNLKTGEEYVEPYDKLILSTGSSPIVPPIEGIKADNIFTLWNIPDTDRIYGFIEEKCPQRAVVIGGGFIGLEMAENLADRGIKITLVEKMNQVMAPIDYEMANIVHAHLIEKGVKLILGDGVESFSHDGGTKVHLESKKEVPTDMIILSIGIRPNSQLARECRLELNQRGGVVVNDFLQTSDESIYAAGDIIETIDYISKDRAMVPLAGPANKQGRIAADNVIRGNKEKYKGVLGTSVAKIFDLTVAATGANEKTLNRRGLKRNEDYFVSVVHPGSHAGYYPGAMHMCIKGIFDKEGKILGAQIVGYKGADKRIDDIATAIKFGGTAYDLQELELAYAPPYSSAKDPVNMLGFTAVNLLEGFTTAVMPDELEPASDDHVIIDVREPEELLFGKVEGSINIPLATLRQEIPKLDKSKKYTIHCAVGLRGYIADRIMKQHGFNSQNLIGGYESYFYTNFKPESFPG